MAAYVVNRVCREDGAASNNDDDDDVGEGREERRSLCARRKWAGSKDACDTRNEGMGDERGERREEEKQSRVERGSRG